MNIELFNKLANIFEKNHFKLFAVGGTSRDYLLGLEVLDYDFVTDATPEEMKIFLPGANYTFAKFGSISTKVDGIKVDIVTLRKEGEYKDYRHPSSIQYVKNIEDDYLRRDFTINAIYMDKNLNIIDPSNGLQDLKNKLIKFIGDPEIKIKEDPLRILRAERFMKKLNFNIEKNSLKAIEKYRYLLEKLNPQKVSEEIKKNNNI